MKKTLSFVTMTVMGLALLGAGCSGAGETGGGVARPPSPNTVAVTYNPGALAQKSITVKVGDFVEFRNSDLKPHWPASNPHPSHSDYPEFDSKAPLKPGEIWRFTASKKGTWKFHDHLNGKDVKFQGELIVE